MAKEVLSYPSEGFQIDNPSDTYLWSADVLNEDNLKDTSIDIKRTEQKCADVTSNNPPKGINCTDISRIDHYVWDEAKVGFVLSSYSGSKNSSFHYFNDMGPGMWAGPGMDPASRKDWRQVAP